MAWSSVAVSADETTWLGQDKPILAGTAAQVNATGGTNEARWDTGGGFAANDSDATYPAARGRDRAGWSVTRPTTAIAANGVTYYMMEWPAANLAEFDGIMILGHNFATIPLDTVIVSVADSANWVTNASNIHTFSTPYTAARRVALLASRYSGVRYLRVRFHIDAGAGAGTWRPQFSELWLFRRRQMPVFPQHSFDVEFQHSAQLEQFRSESGYMTQYTQHGGRADIAALRMRFATVAHADILRSWWSDATSAPGAGGPSLFLPRPNSEPSDCRLVTVPPPGVMPAETRNPSNAEYSFALEESAPFVTSDSA